MLFLALLAFCGFLLTLGGHLSTVFMGTAILAIPDRVLLVACWTGIGCFCLMIFMARAWSLGDFLVNLFDGIPGIYKFFILLMVIYTLAYIRFPVSHTGTTAAPVWLPPDIVHRNVIRVISSFIMLLYFWSACYFWFERPQPATEGSDQEPADDLPPNLPDSPVEAWGDEVNQVPRRRL